MMYILTVENMGQIKVLSCFTNKEDALLSLHQEYDRLNAPSKIIWQNENTFKLISDNGDTKIFQVKETDETEI